MHDEHSRLARAALGINRVAILLAEVALVSLMVLTVYAVVARYFFRSPSIFGVEISTYLLLVVAWLSVGWTHHVGRHVSMEALNEKLGPRWKRFTDVVSQCVILTFCAVLLWSGTQFTLTALERNYRSGSLLKFPLWMAYLLIPVGALLLGMVALLRLRRTRSVTVAAQPQEGV